MGPIRSLFLRELRVARRIGGSATMGVAFFLVLVAITPFALGPDPNLLSRIGPAILWISALLAMLLGLDRLFQADAEDGSLDLFHLAETPLEVAVLVKCLAHWTMTGLPLTLAAPFLGLMLEQDFSALLGVVAPCAAAACSWRCSFCRSPSPC
jgi:heme exporter protein B